MVVVFEARCNRSHTCRNRGRVVNMYIATMVRSLNYIAVGLIAAGAAAYIRHLAGHSASIGDGTFRPAVGGEEQQQCDVEEFLHAVIVAEVGGGCNTNAIPIHSHRNSIEVTGEWCPRIAPSLALPYNHGHDSIRTRGKN